MVELRAEPEGRGWRHYGSRAVVYALLALITVVMLYPFYYMGINSVRSLDQYYAGHGFSLASWRNLFHTLPIGRQLLNSTIITLSAIAILLAVYFQRIPVDVVEAALIDGLGYGRIFFRIMLPLAVPAMATIAVLQFIFV